MKTYTLDEVQDKIIGRRGTPRRERFENKLKAHFNRQAMLLSQKDDQPNN